MARNIRWQVRFKSFKNVDCVINIYDNDWPADTIMQVTGAANPFMFEEFKSEDLLNDVMRYRTGYIRIIEQGTFDSLSAIHPEDKFDRYVEVLYGQDVVFNGYIQQQDFTNELVPTPRELDLPVISPMGLFSRRTFAAIQPPTTKTLGELLDIVLAGSTYSRVYVPDISGVGLDMEVYSLVVSPWNDDYHHSQNVQALSKVMQPETYAYLIESICKAFGWICHDTPDALVFTMFEHTGNYAYYPVGHIGDANYKTTDTTPATAINLEDYFSNADNAANQLTLLPDTGIEISYEGQSGRRQFSFQRTMYNTIVYEPGWQPEWGEKSCVCSLTPVALNEISTFAQPSFDANGKITTGNYCVAWNGYEGILVSVSTGYQDMHELFRLRYYNKKRTGQSWNVTYKALSSHDDQGQYHYTLEALKEDELMQNGYIKIETTTYNDYVEVIFRYHYGGTTYPQLPDNTLILIYGVEFEMLEDNAPYTDYRFKPAEDSDRIPDTGYPAITSQLEMPLSMYRLNDHMIGNAVRAAKLTEYPYLFQPRQMIEQKFTLLSAPALPHTRLFTYMGKKWRIISQTFNPWDDRCTLHIQSSPIFNN